MKIFPTIFLASAFTAGTLLPAVAQTGPSPEQFRPGVYVGPVTATTHCVDNDGNVRLKSAPSTTGSGSGWNNGGVSSPGSAGSSSGAIGGADIAAQNLPRC